MDNNSVFMLLILILLASTAECVGHIIFFIILNSKRVIFIIVVSVVKYIFVVIICLIYMYVNYKAIKYFLIIIKLIKELQ